MIKIFVGSLFGKKMGFGQNGVVLQFFCQNDIVLALHNFFLKFCLLQNDVVLAKTAAKRRRFGAVNTNPKRRRFG